jgi:hypothetical protein
MSEIITVFKAEIEGFKAEIDQMKSQLNSLSSTAKSESGKVNTSMQQVKGTLLEIGTAMGIAFSVGAVIQFGKESVKAFQEAELNAKKLEFAVKNIAGGNNSAFQKLLEQSKQLQEQSIFSDDQIQQAQKLFLTIGLTTEQVNKLIPAVVDAASATGDWEGTVDKIRNGLNGQTRGLKELGIFIDSTSDKTTNYNSIQQQLIKFQGATDTALTTSAGRWAYLKNQIGDVQEAIGEFILSGGDMVSAIFGTATQTLIKQYNANLEETGKEFLNMTNAQRDLEKIKLEDSIKAWDGIDKTYVKTLQDKLSVLKKITAQVGANDTAETQSLITKLRLQEMSLKELEKLADAGDEAAKKELERRKQLTDNYKKSIDEQIEYAKKRKQELIDIELKNEQESNELAERMFIAHLDKMVNETEEGTVERLEAEKMRIEELANFKIQNEDLTQDEIDNILYEANQEKLKIEEEFGKQQDALYQQRIKDYEQFLNTKKQADEEYLNAKEQLLQAENDALIQGAAVAASLFKEGSGFAKAFFLFEKIVAIAKIIQQLQVEKAGYYATAAELSAITPPLAAVYQSAAIAKAQAANVRAGIGIATIAAQTIPAFQLAHGTKSVKGGIEGKDSVPALLMPGEMVIPTKRAKKYRPILESIFDETISAPEANRIAIAMKNGNFADNIANSLQINARVNAYDIANGLRGNDKNIVRELKLLNKKLEGGNYIKIIKRRGGIS